jgi:hypothetical protein
MTKITFLGLAKKVLEEENPPLSPLEIWKIATAKGYEKWLRSEGKTPASTRYAAVFMGTRQRHIGVHKAWSTPRALFSQRACSNKKAW